MAIAPDLPFRTGAGRGRHERIFRAERGHQGGVDAPGRPGHGRSERGGGLRADAARRQQRSSWWRDSAGAAEKSFSFATNRHDLKAAFVFYGVPPKPDEQAKIACPVYGFYAGNDGRISLTVPTTTGTMQQAGKTYEPVIYDGAGHGFMRAGDAPAAAGSRRRRRRRDPAEIPA